MTTVITILNASKKFNGVLDLLELTAQLALKEIANHIELPSIDIVISPCSVEYKTESGILACVSSPYLIDVLLDADHKDISTIIKTELLAVIAHELHHVVRTASGVQEKSLFEILISEGLACHFETKFIHQDSSSFFNDIKAYDWRDLLSDMQPNLSDVGFNYPVYFGGKDGTKFPDRAGYWVGFNLVSEYINKYGGCAASLINTSAESFTEIKPCFEIDKKALIAHKCTPN